MGTSKSVEEIDGGSQTPRYKVLTLMGNKEDQGGLFPDTIFMNLYHFPWPLIEDLLPFCYADRKEGLVDKVFLVSSCYTCDRLYGIKSHRSED